MSASKCRRCGAFIRWIELATGKRMPLDLAADERGNVALIAGKWQVLTREQQQRGGYTLYRSHFSTCPNAAEFRRGRARK